MQQYRYDSLPSRRSFRLFTIIACDIATSKVKCDLRTFNLDDAPQFITASYVWGLRDRSSIRTVDVAGQAIEVTVSLFDFLIQTTPTNTYMWVDQICINQDNVDEREQQVALMRDIYRQALCVQIWLGKQSTTSCANALGDVQSINDAMQRTSGWHTFLTSSRRTRFDTLRDIIDEGTSKYECGHSMRDHFRQLIANPWFSRLWTMQEYVLAKEAIITMDRTIIAARMLFLVFAAVQMAGLDAKWFHDADSRRDFQLVVNTATIWLHCTSKDGLDLVESQYHARYSAATDDRDTVYALLGISNVVAADVRSIRPDYRGDVLSAYKQFAFYYVTRLRSLRAFLLIEPVKEGQDPNISESAGSQVRWPSWVSRPYSKSRFAREQIKNEENHGLSTGGDHTTATLHIDDEGLLHCDGAIIDTIAAVGSSSTDNNNIWTTPFETVNPANARAILDISLYISAQQESPYPTTQSAEEVLGRTLCRDLRYTDTHSTFSVSEFKAWMLAIQTSESVNDPRHPSFDFDRLMVHNGIYSDMRIAVTQTGLLALVPVGVQNGDHVCVLIGGRVPFAIRELDHGHRNGRRRRMYRIVSPIYVHGMMGEKEGLKMIQGAACAEMIFE